MRIIPAVKSIIINNDKILILKKKHYVSNPYDLPGGTVKPFENELSALLREIKEETNMTVKPVKNLGPHKIISLPELQVSANVYLCKYKKGKIKLSGEHQSYQWIPINQLNADYPEWIRESMKHGTEFLHYTSSLRKRDKLRRRVLIIRSRMKGKRKKK
jgi:8-oxo-dGTP diphosphatase